MYCEQCGTKIEEGAKFCAACGAPVGEENEAPQQQTEGEVRSEETQDASAGNEQLQSGEQAEASGAVQTQTAVAEGEPVHGEPEEQTADYALQERKKSPVLKIVIGIVAVAAVVAAAITALNFIKSKDGGDPTDIPVAYIKDEELMLRLNNKNESYLISDDAYVYDDEGEAYLTTVQFSDDGKVVFFADDYSDGEFDLYCRKTNQKTPKGKDADEKGIKISGGVSEFTIAPDGSSVLYKKNDKLYYSNLKEDRKIANDVSDFELSDDCKKVLYIKDDALYLCGLGKKDEPLKLDSDVENIEYADDSLENIYYIKNGALYVNSGKGKEKITSDVYDTTVIGDTMFLTKEEEIQYTFDDLFDDDCAASDEETEYPSYSDFRVGFSFDEDAYDKAWDAYSEKEERDDLRDRYKDDPITVNTYDLYRVEDLKAVKIEEGLSGGYLSGQIFQKAAEKGEFEKIKMSTVTDYYDTVEKIEDFIDSSSPDMFGDWTGDYYVLFENGKSLKIDVDCSNRWDIDISPDGKYIYCLEDLNDGLGTLNRYKLSEKSISAKTKICDDVSSNICLGDGNLIIHGEDDSLGFYDGKYTELSDEETGKWRYINGTLFYLDDCSDSSESGTLMRYKGGKKEKLDDDVYDFEVRGDSLCYYIKDYSTKRSQGDLFKKKGLGKAKMIDTDVERFIY